MDIDDHARVFDLAVDVHALGVEDGALLPIDDEADDVFFLVHLDAGGGGFPGCRRVRGLLGQSTIPRRICLGSTSILFGKMSH